MMDASVKFGLGVEARARWFTSDDLASTLPIIGMCEECHWLGIAEWYPRPHPQRAILICHACRPIAIEMPQSSERMTRRKAVARCTA